jgi:hypothetical protein
MIWGAGRHRLSAAGCRKNWRGLFDDAQRGQPGGRAHNVCQAGRAASLLYCRAAPRGEHTWFSVAWGVRMGEGRGPPPIELTSTDWG